MDDSSIDMPVYQRVKQHLETMIERGMLRSGGLVPSERALAARLKAAPGTVRRAVGEMVAEGKLVRLPRKGTIVSPDLPTASGSLHWAVVVPTMRYFYPQLVDAIEREAWRLGATVTLGCPREDIDGERRFVLRAIEEGARGILLAPTSTKHQSRSRESLEYLGDLNVPVVIMDHWGIDLPLSGIDCVLSDNFAGCYQATVHLIRHGYRRIAMVTGDGQEGPEVRERRKGYLAALADHGLTEPQVPPLHNRTVEEGDTEAITGVLSAGVEAIATTNDRTAAFLLARLAQMGIAVPDDVAVIGYDDELFAEALNPPLTSVRVEKEEIARRAVQLLQERIASGLKGRHKTLVVRPSVVARQSCGRSCSGLDELEKKTEIVERTMIR